MYPRKWGYERRPPCCPSLIEQYVSEAAKDLALREIFQMNITRLCFCVVLKWPAVCGRANMHFLYSRRLRAKKTHLSNEGKIN